MEECRRIEHKLSNGATRVFFNYAGIYFPYLYVNFMPAKDLLKQLKWVREAEIRADDILLMAYGKAGTHWTWELLNMISRDTTEYRPFTKVGAMIEMMSPEMMSQMTSPRVFNTHLPTSLIPKGIIEKKCKIVHVLRNPKDICNSFYRHYVAQLTMEGYQDIIPSFDEYVQNFQGKAGPVLAFSSYPWHIKQVEQFEKDNSDVPVLNLFYEDLKRDPVAEVKKVARFLGKDINDEKLREIVQRCSFTNLKEAHFTKEDSLKKISKGSGDFIYRKGTHWTWEILHMIQNGKAEYHGYTKVGAMLEFTTPEMKSELASPRVFNTHMPPHLLPTEVLKKRCKIVHVMRNPKDVALSFYFHISHRMEALDKKELIAPLDHHLETFRGVNGYPPLCSYPWYIKQIEKFRSDNPDHPVLNIFYEDTKKDPEGQIRKIARFLGKELDDSTVKEISEKCGFDNLKSAHDGKEDIFAKITKGDGAFVYRRGIVGDWKNHFTVAQSEAFDKWIDDEMVDLPIKFQFE